jgi:ubiquinone/menaquinone biosynthesis C-methylase UbiE
VARQKTTISRGAPKGDTYYGKTAQNYEVKRQKQAWWHVEQTEMKALLTQLPDGLRVVDIPFGTGRFVPMYHEKGFKISGLDASGDMISTAKQILGDQFQGVDAHVGDAADLPFEDAQFDLLVSTRFLRDIVVYRVAKDILKEFSRVTKQYAILQLGHNRSEGFVPDPESPMGGSLSERDTLDLLKENDFELMEKRLVLRHDKEGTDIYHMLCRKL